MLNVTNRKQNFPKYMMTLRRDLEFIFILVTNAYTLLPGYYHYYYTAMHEKVKHNE